MRHVCHRSRSDPASRIPGVKQRQSNRAANTEYRVYGKYRKLNGTIAAYTTMGTDDTCFFQVYADDVLVYTSPIIVRKTDAFAFSVDITGAEYIKLVIASDSTSEQVGVILSDLKLVP